MRTIKYTVSREKLISRLPGLFAFLEVDSNGNTNIVKASLGKQGNYGQIVANIIYDKGTFRHTCSDGKELLVTNGEHTYRTLIDTYYRAIQDTKWERNDKHEYVNPFLQFMELGIGLRYVGLSQDDKSVLSCGVEQTKKYALAPDYIYVGEAHTMYNKIIAIKKQIDFYEKHKESCKKEQRYYEELKEEFYQWNGDKLLETLCKLMIEYDTIAEKYLGYSKNTNLTIDFGVNLVSTIKDLGMVTPYIQEWIPGKRYYHGDVVYYVDENGFGLTWVCDLMNGTKPKSGVAIDEFKRPYTEGHFNGDSEMIFFENGKKIQYSGLDIKLPEYWKAQSLNWVEKNIDNKKYWKYTGDNRTKIKGTANSQLSSFRKFETYMGNGDTVETPDKFKDWLWYYRKGTVINREEKNDEYGNIGVLYDQNNDGHYDGIEAIQDGGNNIKFNGNTALNLSVWGDVLTNITAENNKPYADVGTITFEYVIGAHLLANKGYQYVVENGFTYNSMNYNVGDVVDESVYQNNQGSCKPIEWYSVDEDGNYKYFFKDFQYDANSIQGVKYTESYIYYRGDSQAEVLEDINVNGNIKHKRGDIISYSEWSQLQSNNREKCAFTNESIWSLVEQNKFNDYVCGKFDKDYDPKHINLDTVNAPYYYLLYDKMEFDTSNNIDVYNLRVGHNNIKTSYIKSSFEAEVDITHVDFEDTPLIRYDYYSGVSYQPTINNDVNIERGLTQAFEKHIKLGEVKTLEDMENYANGGFFIISKEDIDIG